MKENLISGVVYVHILILYLIISDYEILFMWLCWLSGYFKNIFKN